MSSEKLTGREVFIRYVGILLTVSPIGNFLVSAAFSGIPHWWYPHILWAVTRTVNGSFWFLSGATCLAGLMMLKGRRSSWMFTLAIIGMTIIFGGISYTKDIQDGWIQPTLSLAANCGFFALIYAQEFHQRFEKRIRDAQLNRPFMLALKRGVKIDFDGLGLWAEITEVTNKGFFLKPSGKSSPDQIESREVEIAFDRTLTLNAKFAEKTGRGYFFSFTNLSPSTLNRLHRWAQKKIG